MNRAAALSGTEFRRAGTARRVLHVLIGYVVFLLGAVVGIIVFMAAGLALSTVAGRPEWNPIGEHTVWWMDRGTAVGGWFIGMLAGLAAHRLLSRNYSLIGNPTRCGCCGRVLKGLAEPKCSWCGTRL